MALTCPACGFVPRCSPALGRRDTVTGSFPAPSPINEQFHNTQGLLEGISLAQPPGALSGHTKMLCKVPSSPNRSMELLLIPANPNHPFFPTGTAQGHPSGLTQTRPGLPELLVDHLHPLQAALHLLDAARAQGRRCETPQRGGRG